MWFVLRLQQGKQQRAAIEALHGLDWSVAYNNQIDALGRWNPNPQIPASFFFRWLLGDDFFVYVVAARMPDRFRPPGRGLRYLTAFPQLRELDLSTGNLTDADLEQLRGLRQLRKLRLLGPQTPEYAARLRRVLPNCTVWWVKWEDEIGPTSPAPPPGTWVAATLEREGRTYPLGRKEIVCLEQLMAQRRPFLVPVLHDYICIYRVRPKNRIILWYQEEEEPVDRDGIDVDDDVQMLESHFYGKRIPMTIDFTTGQVTKDEERKPLLEFITRICQESEPKSPEGPARE